MAADSQYKQVCTQASTAATKSCCRQTAGDLKGTQATPRGHTDRKLKYDMNTNVNLRWHNLNVWLFLSDAQLVDVLTLEMWVTAVVLTLR